MTSIGESNILLAVGWAVFNSLWQMAILWVAYQFITTAFKINKSSQKGFLSAVLLFAGFLWFAFTLISGIASNTTGIEGYTALLNIDGNTELGWWLSTMLPIASLLYLGLLIFPILNFIRNYRYVQVIRRYGLSRASVEWRMFVQRVGSQMGIRKPVHIWMSDMITSPVTIGFLKPIILLPMAAVNHLTPRQIEAVILHELSHIKRLDYLVNLITRFIHTILYFNPFVKAFIKIIEREREKSCDETVIQFQYEPHGYASALLVLEKAAHIPQHSLAVAASDGKKSEFRQRIEWIMGIRKKPTFSFNRFASVLAAFLLFIALNALMIFAKPATKMSAGPRSFSLLEVPLPFSTGEGSTKGIASNETHAEPILNNLTETEPGSAAQHEQEDWLLSQFMNNNYNTNAEPVATDEDIAHDQHFENGLYQYVNNLQTIIPQLTALEEKQLQKVVDESKKVIQNIEWKKVEQSIADAFSSAEKAQIKSQINQAIASINTEKLEQNLRMVFDKIDWKRAEIELQNQLAVIKMDSIQQEFTVAIDELNHLEKELIKDSACGIPDTDITVKSIQKKKTELQGVINKIRITKPKKVVRL